MDPFRYASVVLLFPAAVSHAGKYDRHYVCAAPGQSFDQLRLVGELPIRLRVAKSVDYPTGPGVHETYWQSGHTFNAQEFKKKGSVELPFCRIETENRTPTHVRVWQEDGVWQKEDSSAKDYVSDLLPGQEHALDIVVSPASVQVPGYAVVTLQASDESSSDLNGFKRISCWKPHRKAPKGRWKNALENLRRRWVDWDSASDAQGIDEVLPADLEGATGGSLTVIRCS